MKRYLYGIVLLFGLGTAGCGPLYSLACDRVAMRCTDVDLAVCDATMSLAPPHVRREIVDCTAAAKTCEETVACFTDRGYQLPRIP